MVRSRKRSVGSIATQAFLQMRKFDIAKLKEVYGQGSSAV
jgi:hypothetical protein